MASVTSLFNAVLGLILFTILYSLWKGARNVWFHRLRYYPGPLLGRASIWYSSYYHWIGRYPYLMKSLHAKYGPVVRIAPNELSYISAQALQDIYALRTEGDELPNFAKDESSFTRGRKTHTIINAPEQAHQRMRQSVSHAFSTEAVAAQETIVQNHITAFIDQFRAKSQDTSKSTLDIMSWFNFTTFDVLGDLMYGESFRGVKSGSLDPSVGYMFKSMKLSSVLRVARRVPNLAGTLIMVWLVATAPKDAAKYLARARTATEERLKKGVTNRRDFVDEILAHNGENEMTHEEIAASSTALIFLGSETTASVLSGAVFYLLKNEPILQNLVKEIRQSFKSEEQITFKAVSDLEYLDAVLQETLRLYPPAADTLARIVPQPGFIVDGKFVPPGAIIGIQQYAAFRSPRYFKQAESFVPERWLGDALFQDDNLDIVQPFSVGPRDCVGQTLAWPIMRVILARLLWSFDLELLPQSENWLTQENRMLWEKPSLYVTVLSKNR